LRKGGGKKMRKEKNNMTYCSFRKIIRRVTVSMLLIFLLVLTQLTSVLAVPGDEDDDGIITGPRLVGNTVFRGCFVSGPDTSGNQDTDWDDDVDTITDALDGTGSWDHANKKEHKNGNRTDITTSINNAKNDAVAGDEFIFYFSGHGGDSSFPDATEDGEGNGSDNHILIGDTTPGTRDRITDDQLADMLSGFNKSVTIVVILDTCYGHTFFDGADDLGSITQKDNGDDVDAGPRVALIAATSNSTPTTGSGFTDRLADGLEKVGGYCKADKNKDGVVTAKEAADHAKGYYATEPSKCDPAYPCSIPEFPESSYIGPVSPDVDNCPCKYNPDQMDSDGDGYGNVCGDVGGTTIPINTLGILAPYIISAALIISAVAATTLYVKRKKNQ